MTRILAIGECMVEMAPVGEASQFRMGFAGDTLNTAWYLRRKLGPQDQVDYFTSVGSDEISGQMTAFLRDAGIGTDHIQQRDDRTVGLYMIQLRDGERSFSYWRGQSAARTLAEDADALRAALNGADLAYMSGITLAILPDADREQFLSVLDAFRKDGGTVAFDPNLRPKLWASPSAMTDAIMQAAAVSDIVLPSFEDEADWFGDANPDATADRYASVGAGCIVVKNGGGQMIGQYDGRRITCDPVRDAKLVDTTAAGDSFNAGFLAAWLNHKDLHAALLAGSTLAAKVIGQYGALVNIED